MEITILVRGGGDLASGILLRCARAGWNLCVTELEHPLAVRRKVSFSQAVYDGFIEIEGVRAEHISHVSQARGKMDSGIIPVIEDPECDSLKFLHPDVLIDARMTKQAPAFPFPLSPLDIGLGPGFIAGINCHAVIETMRGPFLGRVIWKGPAELDTGIPDGVAEYRDERVLRSPADGIFGAKVEIGDLVAKGQVVAEVGGIPISSPFDGAVRGLIQGGLFVKKGIKVGDIDPRNDPRICYLVSDKALAVGGGVLEAVLSWGKFRKESKGKNA